jgi:hypothetical protein
MAGERHGNGMACVNQTRPHNVNQRGKTHSKAVENRHGRGTAGEQHGNGRGTAWARQGNGMGTAWERHGMCESALSRHYLAPLDTVHTTACTQQTIHS